MEQHEGEISWRWKSVHHVVRVPHLDSHILHLSVAVITRKIGVAWEAIQAFCLSYRNLQIIYREKQKSWPKKIWKHFSSVFLSEAQLLWGYMRSKGVVNKSLIWSGEITLRTWRGEAVKVVSITINPGDLLLMCIATFAAKQPKWTAPRCIPFHPTLSGSLYSEGHVDKYSSQSVILPF